VYFSHGKGILILWNQREICV